MHPSHATEIRHLLEILALHVEDARTARNTQECREALNRVWNDVHDAQEALNDAERETRRMALERIGDAA
jgi:predicted  nucleic acid-binding Zn-ribbon protein